MLERLYTSWLLKDEEGFSEGEGQRACSRHIKSRAPIWEAGNLV